MLEKIQKRLSGNTIDSRLSPKTISCKQLESGYFLKLNRGDDVLDAFKTFALTKQLKSAFFTGIGALEDVKLGYYDLPTKTYLEKEFEGEWELLNLTGNITWKDGKFFVHAHVTLSDKEFRTIGGHLFHGKIAITGEFFVNISKIHLLREYDEETGLYLINLD